MNTDVEGCTVALSAKIPPRATVDGIATGVVTFVHVVAEGLIVTGTALVLIQVDPT